jgi:hypothetical protein
MASQLLQCAVNSSRRGDGLSSPASRIREKRADSARRRRKMKLSTPRATAGRNATRHPQSEYCDSLSTASRRRGTAKASVHPATTLEVAKRGQGGDQAGRGEHGLAPVGIGVGAHDWGAAAHGGAGKRRASKNAGPVSQPRARGAEGGEAVGADAPVSAVGPPATCGAACEPAACGAAAANRGAVSVARYVRGPPAWQEQQCCHGGGRDDARADVTGSGESGRKGGPREVSNLLDCHVREAREGLPGRAGAGQ